MLLSVTEPSKTELNGLKHGLHVSYTHGQQLQKTTAAVNFISELSTAGRKYKGIKIKIMIHKVVKG